MECMQKRKGKRDQNADSSIVALLCMGSVLSGHLCDISDGYTYLDCMIFAKHSKDVKRHNLGLIILMASVVYFRFRFYCCIKAHGQIFLF